MSTLSVTEVGTPSAAAIASGSNTGSVTGSFSGTQTRTAGNLLEAKVTAWGSTSAGAISTATTGWSLVASDVSADGRNRVAIFTKVATGSDTAPTFTATMAGTAALSRMSCKLKEMTGQDDTNPIATTASGDSTTSPASITTGAVVPLTGCYADAVWNVATNSVTTCTIGAGSGWTNQENTGSTSARSHSSFDQLSNPTQGSALTEAATSTGTLTDFAGCMIVIRPPSSKATVAIAMKKMSLSGSSAEKAQGTGAISMKKFTLSGSSAEKSQATVAIRMKKMSLSGSGTEKAQITGAISMKKMSLSGSGTGSSQAMVAISMKKMSLSGSGTGSSQATVAISMKKMSLSGSSAERSDATAAISMKKMSLSGSSAERSDISAAISMKKMSIAASVTVSSGADEFTGAISMKKFRLSGSSAEKSAATAAISMKKFRLSGSGTGKSTATVTIAMKKMSLSATVIDPVTKLQNTGEGGTSGTAVTTGNSGGISGSAFDAIQATSGGAVTFDNAHSAHGGLSYKIVTGGTAGNSLLEWTTSLTGSTVPKVWFRVYCYFTAFSGTVRIIEARNGSTTRAIVAINSSGKVQSLNAAGTALKTSTLTVPTNQWFRIEGFFIGDASVGQVEFKLFTTAMDELVPDEVQTSAATQNTGGTINRIDYGNPSSVSSYTFWIDDLAASLTGYLGPRVVDSTIAISMKKFKLASSVAGHSAATVAIRMKKMSLSGSSAEKSQVTVDIRMKKMRLSGSSAEKSQATVAISMKKMRIAVVVSDAGLTELTGLVVMKKMRLSGVSHEHAYLTGHVVMKKMTLAIDVEAPVETHVTVVIVMKKMTFRSHIRQHGASELFIFSPV